MSHPNDNAFPGQGSQGLTKREYIATQIYASYVGNVGLRPSFDGQNDRQRAIQAADNLIVQLGT